MWPFCFAFSLVSQSNARLLIPMQFVSSSFGSLIQQQNSCIRDDPSPLSSTPQAVSFLFPTSVLPSLGSAAWSDTMMLLIIPGPSSPQIPQWIQMLRSVLVSWEMLKSWWMGKLPCKWQEMKGEDRSWRKASLGKWSGFVSGDFRHSPLGRQVPQKAVALGLKKFFLPPRLVSSLERRYLVYQRLFILIWTWSKTGQQEMLFSLGDPKGTMVPAMNIQEWVWWFVFIHW